MTRMKNLDPITFQQSVIKQRIKELRDDLPHLYGQKFYPWSREFFESRNRMNLLCAANQIGKAICNETLIPTPHGFKKNGDLVVGDIVFGRDGKPTKVLATTKRDEQKCYRITFDDKTSIIASDDHLWVCKGYKQRFRKKYKSNGTEWINPEYDQWVVKTTEQIINEGKYDPNTSQELRFVIPICDAVNYEEKDLFDPYLVGLLLGDGCLTTRAISLTTDDEEIVKYVSENHRHHIGEKAGTTAKNVVIKDIADIIESIGLLGKNSSTKFIPEYYKLGSIEQRKKLLAGLLDTDGSIYGKGVIEFCSVSKQLAEDFAELVRSLGGKAEVKLPRESFYIKDGQRIYCQNSYRVFIKTLFNPFGLSRKAEKWYVTRYKHERVIYSIEKVETTPSTCIRVDNKDSTYIAGREYFVTHNSSIAIRKNIEWACNKKLWPSLWDSTPKQFWYFYPSDQVATVEVEKKWVPEFLPRGDMKNHEHYGWDIEYKSGDVAAIHFRSGCSIFFKSYGQKVVNLQTSSVHMMTFDEEAPEEIVNECLARLRATRGYFNQVFTATRGLQLWYRAMECIGTAEEVFKDAWKRSVSMRDCMFYEDGTPSQWTPERIKEAESYCTSQSEILKRIDGRFVKDEGRKYLTFDPDRCLGDASEKIPRDWRYYAGVDIGSGGRGRSAGAVVIVACSPTLDRGRVVRTWRGDYEETTAKDILEKYKELREGISITQACYDYQSREFGLIASRSGEPFLPADKQRNSGEQIANTLFQSGALTIDQGVYDNQKLVTELMSVPAGEKNRKYQDDLTDALRYVLKLIPWDFVKIAPNLKFDDDQREDVPDTTWTKDQWFQWEIKQRRGEMFDEHQKNEWQSFSDEVAAWNEIYGN